MVVASQTGRSGGGAARWMATRVSTAASNSCSPVGAVDEQRQQIVPQIFLQQQPCRFVGREDLRHRHPDRPRDAARCARMAGRPRAAARPSAPQDAARRSAADSAGNWRPAPAVRSSRSRNRGAREMPRSAPRGSCDASQTVRPPRQHRPPAVGAGRMQCHASVRRSVAMRPAGPAIPPARCRRAPRPSPAPSSRPVRPAATGRSGAPCRSACRSSAPG